MANFLYMHAGAQLPVTHERAIELGLGYAFDGNVEPIQINDNNKSGKAGYVFGTPSEGRPVRYIDAEQTWRRMPNGDGPELWLGFWNDAKPTPADLRRRTDCRTSGVLLDDGQWWEVPIVGHREETRLVTDLPAFVDFDADGKRIRGAVPAKYASLWDQVATVADKHFAHEAGEGPEVTDDEQWEATVALLQTTYRVGPIELATLRTFLDGSQSFVRVWMVATAYDWLMETLADLQKKSSP